MARKRRPIKASRHHHRLVELVLKCAFPNVDTIDGRAIAAAAQRFAERIGHIERGYTRIWNEANYFSLGHAGSQEGELRCREFKDIDETWGANDVRARQQRAHVRIAPIFAFRDPFTKRGPR